MFNDYNLRLTMPTSTIYQNITSKIFSISYYLTSLVAWSKRLTKISQLLQQTTCLSVNRLQSMMVTLKTTKQTPKSPHSIYDQLKVCQKMVFRTLASLVILVANDPSKFRLKADMADSLMVMQSFWLLFVKTEVAVLYKKAKIQNQTLGYLVAPYDLISTIS